MPFKRFVASTVKVRTTLFPGATVAIDGLYVISMAAPPLTFISSRK